MANRRRNSRGRFVSGGSKPARRSRRARGAKPLARSGMGSVYAVKRRGMGGLGALSSTAFSESILPILVGGGLAGATIFAIRKWVTPADTTTEAVFKYAPLMGIGTGAVAALSLKWLAGSDDAAVGGLVAAAVVGGLGMVMDMVAPETTGAAAVASLPASGTPAANGYRGMGAIVPEYGSGMGAIVYQPMAAGGRRPGSIGSYGETVNLSGINTSVFGTPGF